jgi:serine/threonine protein kinase
MGHWKYDLLMGTTRTCSSCGERITGTLDHCPKDGTPFFSEEVMARVGMVIKDHEIQGVIGEGGMGVVYRAQHVVIEKPVAIKVLHDHFAKQKEMVEQFIIEAKAASRIRHPNIIDVTDFGTTPEGLFFLVMEYLDGESLEDRLARVGRLPVFDAVNIVKQVARGLGAAHALGIVHRDLKPANIFLCEREGRRRIVRRTSGELGPQFTVEAEQKFDLVKLLDFGVAKFMDLGPSAATRAGVLCGTPHYLSPEQAQEQPATERSDLYALGAVFYEMIAGSVPFDGSSMFEILKGHVVGTLVPASRRAPDAGIDAPVDAVIARCLEKEPSRRFANTDELCEALDECVSDRAFLRDAHRLPGIGESGLDLSDAGLASRRRTPVRGAAAERGFSEVERESDLPDIADLDERPGRRKRSRGSRDTVRIPRQNRGIGAVVLVVLIAAGVAGAIWVVRDRAGDQPAGTVPPPTPAGQIPAATPGTGVAAAPGASVPSGTAPGAAPTGTSVAAAHQPGLPGAAKGTAPSTPGVGSAAPKPAGPTGLGPVLAKAPGQDKASDRDVDRTGQPRTRSVLGASPRLRSLGLPPPGLPPEPPVPIAVETPSPTPPPPPPAPSTPVVDVNALLKEAQQAWTRQHYGVAIDKAREVLKAAPGRHDAYQIIAVCSCAIGAAADAREAVSHLDSHKQKLVQSLCKNHGVTLE